MSAPLAFTATRKVMFQHCDPAGIVFYPRYFEMLNAVVEDWFERGLGVSFAELHLGRKVGVPLVHAEADFRAPSRLGETLEFTLTLAKIGRASAHLLIAARCGRERRLDAGLVLSAMDLVTARAVPWPEDLRAPMRRYLKGESEAHA